MGQLERGEEGRGEEGRVEVLWGMGYAVIVVALVIR